MANNETAERHPQIRSTSQPVSSHMANVENTKQAVVIKQHGDQKHWTNRLAIFSIECDGYVSIRKKIEK